MEGTETSDESALIHRQPSPAGIALYRAKLTSGGTTPYRPAEEISHAIPSKVQTPHLPCPGHFGTPLQPDDSSQEHVRPNGGRREGDSDSDDEAERPQQNSVENDNMADPGSYTEFSSIGGVPKLTRLLDRTPEDALGTEGDVEMVFKESFSTQGLINGIASSRQQQPPSLEGSPAPLCIPVRRMSPISQSPRTAQHQPSQELLRRTARLSCEARQEFTGNAASPTVQFPSLPRSRSLSTLSPTSPKETTDPQRISRSELVNGGDNSCQESPKPQWKLRLAAFDKDRHPSNESSIDSDDEGADEFEDTDDNDDDYTGRPPRKRRKNLSGSQVPKPQHSRLSGFRRPPHPYGIYTPPSSQIYSDEEDAAGAPTAAFEEWPLQDAVLKRVTEGGQMTFQLQFTWGFCRSQGLHGCASPSLRDQSSASSVKRGMLSTADSDVGDSMQHDDEAPNSDEEYVVEQIRAHRFTKPGNQGLELRVKWRNTRKLTWEPVVLMEDTEAYDTYLKDNNISRPSKTRKRGRPRKSATGDYDTTRAP